MSVEVKNFESPDEVRPFEGKGHADVVNIGGRTVGRGTFEPGWKWSENVKPIAKTDSCEVSHLGYVLSGTMRVYMHDGGGGDAGLGDLQRSRNRACRPCGAGRFTRERSQVRNPPRP